MKYEIVIARYNENLDWIKDIPKNIKITIYNKGLDNIKESYIRLPNIGRESHTYLYHIINNYDNLSNTTIFCQGDSIFHSPDFIKLLKNIKYFEPIQPLSAYYWPPDVNPFVPVPPLYILKATENLHIKDCKIHVEYVDNDFNTHYPYYYYCDGFRRYVDRIKKIYNVNNVLEFNVKRFLLKNVDYNKLIPICFAGLFSVTKDVIQENTVDFYNNIMSILIYDIRNINVNKKVDHGLFLEKLWLLIFNYKKNNKNYIDLDAKKYILSDYNLNIKNNTINFQIFIIECDIYIDLFIDNIIYNIAIGRKFLILYCNKKLIQRIPIINNKNIQNILKEANIINIIIIFKNNKLVITCNNLLLFNYVINGRLLNKITKATIYNLSKDNKFIDLQK